VKEDFFFFSTVTALLKSIARLRNGVRPADESFLLISSSPPSMLFEVSVPLLLLSPPPPLIPSNGETDKNPPPPLPPPPKLNIGVHLDVAVDNDDAVDDVLIVSGVPSGLRIRTFVYRGVIVATLLGDGGSTPDVEITNIGLFLLELTLDLLLLSLVVAAISSSTTLMVVVEVVLSNVDEILLSTTEDGVVVVAVIVGFWTTAAAVSASAPVGRTAAISSSEKVMV
jgi:hypothetical protein